MVLQLLRGPFTVDAYQRLIELGVLHEDDRVELIDGQVVEMSPIGPRHAHCVRRLIRLLSRTLPDMVVVDVQNPILLGERHAPQPDLTLLRSNPLRHHPGPNETLVVIEVADSSVDYDTEIKGPLYAGAGIPEMWLVNLPAERVELYTEPAAGGYTSRRSVRRGDVLTSLQFPEVILPVTEILE